MNTTNETSQVHPESALPSQATVPPVVRAVVPSQLRQAVKAIQAVPCPYNEKDHGALWYASAHAWDMAMIDAIRAVNRLIDAPAPEGRVVVPEGWKQAAAFIEKKAQDYINENASTEHDTGATVWHYGDAGCDYHSTLVELAEELLAAAPAAQEPAAPAILEAISWHSGERDDLTLEETVEALRHGYKKVRQRDDRAMLLQLIHLMASAPAAQPIPPESEVQADEVKLYRDPIGPENDSWLTRLTLAATEVVCAGRATTQPDAVAEPVARVTTGAQFGPGLAFLATGRDFPKPGTLLYTAAPAQEDIEAKLQTLAEQADMAGEEREMVGIVRCLRAVRQAAPVQEAIRDAALEEAAKACEKWRDDHSCFDTCTYTDCDFNAAATDCAAVIRALRTRTEGASDE